jgi:4-hydroxybenzoate polyprenyltransferase
LKFIKENFFLFKVHHWIKNLIIFLPIIASHSFLNITKSEYVLHFLNFSILASIVYLINNINDYTTDIKNKKLRYSINLDKKKNYYIFSSLIIVIQTLILYLFDIEALIICSIYLFVSITYNNFLRHQKYLDILIISLFHILRIYYGAVVFEIELSLYFTLFCFFIFLMIGTNKRIIEVQKNFENRPYKLNDKKRLNLFQLLFGILAILTFFFYCIDPSKSQLFNNGYFLYINLVLIILIIGNFLFFQKSIDQDIVVFIYSNKINFILVTIFFILFIRNSAFF